MCGALLVSGPATAQMAGVPADVGRAQAEASRALMEAAVGAPVRVMLADQATLRLDGGLQFIARDTASRYLRAFSLPEPDGLVGLFLYGGRTEPWMATIRLVRDGFVDAKALTRWSADDLLASIKDDVAKENKDRVAKGLPPRVVGGWRIPPTYDPENNSLLWSVQSYVSGVSSMNETDATVHLAIFGRDGYFQIDIISNGATIRANRGDIALFTNNLRFVDGKEYRDFVFGVDPVARQGLETVFDVSTLRHVGFLESELEGERMMIFTVGGALVLGAGIMAGVLAAANRRRNRRI